MNNILWINIGIIKALKQAVLSQIKTFLRM